MNIKILFATLLTLALGAAIFEFDAAKNQMIIKRRGGQERVLTKEK